MSFGPRLLRLAVLLLAALGAVLLVVRRQSAETDAAGRGFGFRTARPFFVDVTQLAGIQFFHNNGAFGRKYMPETTGSGCAFFDYDNDGWLDLLIVNSKDFPGRPQGTSRLHLYHNLRNGTFEEVAARLGVAVEVYGMGCAIGDYDNDGWSDVYLTCLGPNYLFRNVGGKRFEEVATVAGVRGNPVNPGGLQWKWSSSAAWLDYDLDGRLDLFVGNYVKWTPEIDVWCGYADKRGYCPPNTYHTNANLLYHNEGNGVFQEVSAQTGLAKHEGKCWGVAVCDFDGDRYPDLAVANDTYQNFLFRNLKGEKFEEIGVEAGIAYSEMAKPKAGMGIDVADFDNQGRFGLAIGNFSSEGVSLYRRTGDDLVFYDDAHKAGVGGPSLSFLTFGLFFFDYDLDGWKDLFCANGHIDDIVGLYEAKITYAERPLLYRNRGAGQLEEVGLRAGPPFQKPYVLRGCAYGDYDRDGDLDICVVGNNRKVNRGRAMLWRNEGGNRNAWLTLKLRGTHSNRNGFGTVVRVTADGMTQTDVLRSGSSYLSQNQPWLTFGLGRSRWVQTVAVSWPSGKQHVFREVESRRTYEIVENGGINPVR